MVVIRLARGGAKKRPFFNIVVTDSLIARDGRLIAAWGIKGGIKVQPFAQDPQALFSSRRWFLQPPEASSVLKRPASATTVPPLLKITHAKEQGDWVVAQAQDISDRNAAEA